MRWLERLADELAVLGVRGRERRRILLELHDHIECDPGCEDRLGAPRELAASFADELATDRARRSAFNAFGALAIAAAALIVSQLAIGHAGGYPGFTNGLSVVLFMPAAIGILIAPQVALVAGVTLLGASRTLARAGAVVSGTSGQAGDIYDDLPSIDPLAVVAAPPMARGDDRFADRRRRNDPVPGPCRALADRRHSAGPVRGTRRRGGIRSPGRSSWRAATQPQD